ncbi:MAG: 2-C-methyl-D-erythritol 4-phosphate cytidylyltransferase [Gammaproteobacteria bacterium]|nr:2-C-methyl-D-erythritol 4-phosphate cytidylyltransferase [Gammaproteobacteria bacterium]MBQ0840806.1 2-C-methyl-D-erythritol 4-phosphate cytidylyltransferase [Gammaproteobacteria bacterium]
MKYWLIVPAAGSGSRFGGERPKQYAPLAGRTVIEHTLERLLTLNAEALVLALNPADSNWQSLAISRHPKIRSCTGGAERAESVYLALQSIASEANEADWVLVHDVARPCVRVEDMRLLIETLSAHPVGGLLATPVSATLKRVGSSKDADPSESIRKPTSAGAVLETVARDNLWAAATPQMFRYGLLVKALQDCRDAGINPTDEAGAVEHLGLQAEIVAGHSDNLKITHGTDLALAEAVLAYQQHETQG